MVASSAAFAERDERVTLADGATLAYSLAPARAPLGWPCVVLLHGLASNRTRWQEFAEKTSLTRHFDVVRLDLRGHGESSAGGSLTLERWCDDIAGMLAARLGRNARTIVIGHSLGAQVALAFAARYPQHCAGIGLVDPVFRDALRGKWRVVAGVRWVFVLVALLVRAANALGLRRKKVVQYDLKSLDAIARAVLGSPEAEADFIRRYSSVKADLRHAHTATYFYDLAAMFRRTPALASLRLPVIALLSTGATFADGAAMARLLGALPRQQTQWIECHHWPLTEKPYEVRHAIERWCESLA
jgi:pimeloyl-ACP methyl ester carboxylesterase